MKPLLLVSELEDYTIAFANGVAAHVPVVLAVPERRYAHLAQDFDPRVDLRLMDWPRHSSARNPAFLLAMNRLVRAEMPDVIHMLSNTVLWLNLVLPFWRAPVITTVHDVVVHPGDRDTQVLPRWATDMAVRQSGDIVVHGEGLREHAAQRFGKPGGRLHVLSHPAIGRYADLARAEGLRPSAAQPGAFNVLLFGRIFAYKGLEQLVLTEAALGDRLPGLRITIAGRGDDPWTMRNRMGDPARYDIRNRFIEDREVAQLFLDADVVALPYTEASQSGVLNVAAAFGKPMVATDVGELRRTIEGNRMGLVVPPCDPSAFAGALTMLAGRPDLRTDFGLNARRWAEGSNAPATVGGAAVTLYRHIVNRSNEKKA